MLFTGNVRPADGDSARATKSLRREEDDPVLAAAAVAKTNHIWVSIGSLALAPATTTEGRQPQPPPSTARGRFRGA